MLLRNFMAILVFLLFSTNAFAAAPLPDSARGVPIPQDKGYHVEEISSGLYWVTEGAYTMMFLTTGQGVIVVDAPPTIGKKILKAIEDVTDEPITHVIYSHSHADHIGAAAIYPKDAKYIAHEDTKVQLERVSESGRTFPYGAFVGGSPVPLPTKTFKDKYTLKVGKQVLKLIYDGDDHDPGNIYIYAPKQKVLMKIDIIFPGWTPFKGLAIAEDIPGYIEAHDIILSYDFDKLVSGHWGKLAIRKDVEVQKEYIQDIQANAGTALQTVDFYAIAKETGFENTALLFDTYLDAVAQKCADLTEPKWVSRLGGVDIWTFDHCHQVIMSLRVD
jgi:glyoxylase-like metal-dependent hydrolase (beta-lactamase superfamily II)